MALVDAYVKAVCEYNRLQSAQLAALVRGKGFQFEAEMQSARRTIRRAKALILKHEQEHGCDAPLATVVTA